MTTKLKIVAGFMIMMILLGGLAFLGYQSTQRASNSFDEYERLAHLNIAASDLISAMYKATTNLYSYVASQDPQDMNQSRDAVKEALARLDVADGVVLKAERRNALSDLRKGVMGLTSMQDQIQRSMAESETLYKNVVQVEARSMMENLKEMTQHAARVQSVPALVNITEVWDDLAAARSSLSRYAESFEPGDATRTRENLAHITTAMDRLRPDMQASGAGRLFQDLNKNFQDLTGAFTELEKRGSAILSELANIERSLGGQIEAAHKLNSDIAKEMDTFGVVVHDDNTSTQRNIIGLSLGGILLGAAIATFIVFSLIRVLNQMSSFAIAVSQGEFNHPITVKEGGEIGTMLNAMKAIPTVLNKLISEADILAGRILVGHFNERIDESVFPGAYKDLTRSINTVSNAYTRAIDAIPLPIIACDLDFNMIYINEITQTVLGGNPIGENCGKHFKSPVCGTQDCFGMCAKKKNGQHIGETDVHPNGLNMDIAVTAIPLKDTAGVMQGHLEICTDLSEIKAKQRTIITVANQASEIADRVAAASEEIATQVEQITQGAEIQRSRVESTASAMTEMNATVLEVARNSGQASEQSENTRSKAQNGANLVNQVVAAIHTVNEVSTKMQTNMEELGTQAESIGGVMNVISDIADQTNLLALNAAIEAARAGEAGRGFAVVADEVRKLAEKTMQATHEVGSNITAIQHSTKVNIEEMGNAAKGVSEATQLANSSGEALDEIVQLASANSSVVASIATAAEQQSATSEEINGAIDEINRIVAETTEGMTQSSAAVQELSRMAQELRTVMDNLKEA